jgi:hypothetical protein
VLIIYLLKILEIEKNIDEILNEIKVDLPCIYVSPYRCIILSEKRINILAIVIDIIILIDKFKKNILFINLLSFFSIVLLSIGIITLVVAPVIIIIIVNH